MSWELDGRPLRRVLVSRLRYLGDIAMATVVLRTLRHGDPGLETGFLCEESHASVLRGHPDLDHLHALRIRRHGADEKARRRIPADPAADHPDVAGTLGTIGRLRRLRYDAAVDLFFNPRSAWLLALTGIPRRLGGARGSRRRLYTDLVDVPTVGSRPGLAALALGGLADHLARCAPLRHRETGLSFLDWLEKVCPAAERQPRVPRPPLAGTAAERALHGLGVSQEGYTLLAPAATWETKEWPAAHWEELIRAVAARRGEPLVVLCPPGGPGPYAGLARAIEPGRGGLLPPLSLPEALNTVGAAGRLITVDGGVMHAAVAMQIPTVALFGATEPAIWFPYESMGPYRVLATRPACHPCHRHTCDQFVCLPDLEVATVCRILEQVAPC